MKKVGYVTIVGRPNVGKSTLLNSIINKKVAITSDKSGTTRNIIEGIYNDEESQIIFLDTPGIHKPQNNLGRNINKMATLSLNDVDVVLFMISYDMPLGRGDEFIMDILKNSDAPKKYLLINKIDLAPSKGKVLDLIAKLASKGLEFDEIFPLSAMEHDNVDELVKCIKNDLEEDEEIYPEDQLVNYTDNFMIAEIIREKILNLTKEEIPHSVAVKVEHKEWNEEEKEYEIHATIVVERDSQKGIIIGKQGDMLANINRYAQREIRELLKKKVYLRLWVKVKKDWRNNDDSLNALGYRVE